MIRAVKKPAEQTREAIESAIISTSLIHWYGDDFSADLHESYGAEKLLAILSDLLVC